MKTTYWSKYFVKLANVFHFETLNIYQLIFFFFFFSSCLEVSVFCPVFQRVSVMYQVWHDICLTTKPLIKIVITTLSVEQSRQNRLNIWLGSFRLFRHQTTLSNKKRKKEKEEVIYKGVPKVMQTIENYNGYRKHNNIIFSNITKIILDNIQILKKLIIIPSSFNHFQTAKSSFSFGALFISLSTSSSFPHPLSLSHTHTHPQLTLKLRTFRSLLFFLSIFRVPQCIFAEYFRHITVGIK